MASKTVTAQVLLVFENINVKCLECYVCICCLCLRCVRKRNRYQDDEIVQRLVGGYLKGPDLLPTVPDCCFCKVSGQLQKRIHFKMNLVKHQFQLDPYAFHLAKRRHRKVMVTKPQSTAEEIMASR